MVRPEPEQLDAAQSLLERLAGEHGLSQLRHGDEFGEVVAVVADGRTYFDVVAFEDAVEGRLGWRPPGHVRAGRSALRTPLRHAARAACDSRWRTATDGPRSMVLAIPARFRAEGIKVLTIRVGTPVANAFAERWIGSLRRELLDRTIMWNRRQRQRLVIVCVDYYSGHRPHRALQQRPPSPPVTPDAALPSSTAHIARLRRCDGFINGYGNSTCTSLWVI